VNPAVIVEDMTFSYGRDFHLNLPHIQIYPGMLTVILGPNGSGKTTFFSLLRGRLKPDNGKITVFGKNLSIVKDRERAALIGLVPQRTETAFAYTVQQMVAMGYYRKTKSLWQDTVDHKALALLMDRLDLKSLADREVNSLSGGEYQRVLLARVLAQDPKVLLLDEPANHLDLHHQDDLLCLLKGEAERGKTVIAILHDINQALLYADRVILLHEGNCEDSGLAREVVTPENINKVYKINLDYYHHHQEDTALLGPIKS
jgi:iron complex transport system ATP-binding protein